MRRMIVIVGLLFMVGIALGFTGTPQIFINQINQTNGEKFTEAVMPASYVTNATVNPGSFNAANATGVLPRANHDPNVAYNISENTWSNSQVFGDNLTAHLINQNPGADANLGIRYDGVIYFQNRTGVDSRGEISNSSWSITKPLYLLGLGAATSGTTLVLAAGNEVRPLSSSGKTKHNIKSILDSSTICDISKIDVSTFNWNGNNQSDMGLIVEQAVGVCPQIVNFATGNTTMGGVNYAKGDPMSINWAALTSLELQKIKEQQQQIDYLYTALKVAKP